MTNLKTTGNVWIFQGDPKKYDITTMLGNVDIANEFHWKVSRYRGNIHAGDIGLIWLAGEHAGIYAVTQILSNPDFQSETEAERRYWLRDAEDLTELRVKMKLITNLAGNPITRDEIKRVSGLEELSIIKSPKGTNFKVSADEWQLIGELIAKHQVLATS